MRVVAWVFWHVVKPLHLRLRNVTSRLIDRRLGIVTTDEVVADALGAEIGQFRRTQRALGWSGARRMVRRLGLLPGDVVLDIGCGAGRVACVAARVPVARVIGIDLDPRMAELARRNASSLRGRRAPIEIVEGDAIGHGVPDDVTCVYMNNPFGGDLLDAMLRELLESVDRRRRGLRLAYANPREHDLVLSVGRFRPSGRMSLSWRPGGDWARTQAVQFYEVEPSRAGAAVEGTS